MENTTMTILEAMKEMKLIDKKMKDNSAQIQMYSSQPSNEKPLLDSVEIQKKKIKELAQANEDLAVRSCELNARINYTNLFTIVNLEGKKYSINDLLQYRRKLATSVTQTYTAMNDTNYTSKGNSRIGSSDSVIERYYDNQYKQNKLSEWQDFYHTIDSRLEVVNATTPLAEMPKG